MVHTADDKVLTDEQLLEHGINCPAAGIEACDNGGECGLCLQEVPRSFHPQDCPYGRHLPHCTPQELYWLPSGHFCEANAGARQKGHECGTEDISALVA